MIIVEDPILGGPYDRCAHGQSAAWFQPDL